MKQTESIFKTKSEVDSKSILNKLNRKADQTILDKIEAGVTIEDLDLMVKSGLPILKYHTQITIHGIFDELTVNYIFGYKNIFQNKNKSIGVKYNAIDEQKRQNIAPRLACLGFNYTRNSQETKFSIVERIDPENFEAVKAKFLQLKSNIDTSLFYGSVSIWVGEAWGMKYLCFDLYINAIYERNIEPFLNGMGATIELLNELNERKEREQREYSIKLENERKEREIVRQQALKDNENDLTLLAHYNRVTKVNEPGLYLLRTFNYDDKLIYKVIYIYMPSGKKKVRHNKTEYSNINEALKHNPEQRFSDSIYNGRVTGYKLS
jgi:hypothetical protein